MRKIIIDCDPGIDDALAIMLAVNSPELEIVAITTVSGNVPSDMGAVNAKKVLKQLNRLDIPVYIGEDAPLREEYIDARDTHGMDGLGESFLPEVSSGCEEAECGGFSDRDSGKRKDLDHCSWSDDKSCKSIFEEAGAYPKCGRAGFYGRQFQKSWKLFTGSRVQLLV